MPNRIIREGINSSPRVNALSMGAELFYRRLMTIVDDYGRYHGSVVVLRAACWPTNPERFSEKEAAKWLNELLRGDEPLVKTYSVAGAVYIEIQEFGQRTRSESKFPAPPWQQNDSTLTADCGQAAANPPRNARPMRSRISKCVDVVRSASAAPARSGQVVEMPKTDFGARYKALYDRHIIPGFFNDGQYEYAEIVGNSVNQDAAADSIDAKHVEWMQFFRENPNEYRPGIGKWLKEGYFTRSPVRSRDAPSGQHKTKQQQNADLWSQA